MSRHATMGRRSRWPLVVASIFLLALGPPAFARQILAICLTLAALAAAACLVSLLVLSLGILRRSRDRDPVSISFHGPDYAFVENLRSRIPSKLFHVCSYDPLTLDKNTVNWYARFFFRAHAIIYMNPRNLARPSPWVQAEINLARRFDLPVIELKTASDLDAALSQVRNAGQSAFRATLDNLQLIASTLQNAADSEGLEMDAGNDVFAIDPEIVMGQEQRDQGLLWSVAPIIIAWSAGYLTLVLLIVCAVITLARFWPCDLLGWLYV